MNDQNVIRDPVTGAVMTMDYASANEKNQRANLLTCLQDSTIPDHSILANLGLFMTAKTLSRIMFMREFYLMGMDTMGQVFDFGTRWGQNMAVWIACRDMFEPFNRHRKIVGFDTFGGFPSTSEKDGKSVMIADGNIPTTVGYETELRAVLGTLEASTGLPHLNRFELVKGDACQTIHEYFERNPHATVSHAFFDFDLYEPTLVCLREVWDRMPIGGVIGFDEVNDVDSPGETEALNEALGISNVRLQRFPWVQRVSYLIKE